MPKYQATSYIRLSYTDDRSSESDSVTNQRKLIENFIERNPDIEIISEKIDDGYSGIIFDRPAFKEMMAGYYRWQDQLRHSQGPFPPGGGNTSKPGAICGGCSPLMESALLRLRTTSTPPMRTVGTT